MKTFKQYILQEKSINSIKPADIINKKFFAQMDNFSDISDYMFNYNIDQGEEDIYKDVTGEKDFQDWLEFAIEDRFNDIVSELKDSIKRGKLPIFREMMVTKDWIKKLVKQGKHLGVFWSWDEDAAEAHWGTFAKGYHRILLFSSIKEKYVDWLSTIQKNMIHSTYDEKEIELFKGTPLTIDKIYISGKEEKLPPEIYKKVFKA